MNAIGFLFIVILLASALCPSSASAELTVSGSDLLEDGQPVRTVSVNRWDLLWDYLADEWPQVVTRGKNQKTGVEVAQKDLETLSALDLKVLRVSSTLFWSKPMQRTYYTDPEKWWRAFDWMMDDCDRHGIRLILLLNHNHLLFPDLGHESVQDFFRSDESVSRQLHDDYIQKVVNRYKDRKTVYFWEIANERNLGENLAFHDPEESRRTAHLHGMEDLMTYPIVRGASNHYTTEDTVAYMKETAELIHGLDDRHLVGSGNSTPRPSAMHLWRAQQTHGKGDWTFDTFEETTEYIRMTHPDPVDLISVHYYDEAEKLWGGKPGNLENIGKFMEISRIVGKPVYFGEMGPPGHGFAEPDQVQWLRRAMETIEREQVPLTLFWTWNDRNHPPFLIPGETDEAIRIISRCQ